MTARASSERVAREYQAARKLFGVSASETLREMRRDLRHLDRLDLAGVSDCKFIEEVMEAMWRVLMRDGRR